MEQLQRSLGALSPDLTRRALSTTQQRRQVLKWMLVLGGSGVERPATYVAGQRMG